MLKHKFPNFRGGVCNRPRLQLLIIYLRAGQLGSTADAEKKSVYSRSPPVSAAL